MSRITRAIIICGWIVVGLAVAVIWPFVALCSLLAGVALFFVSHLLRLAKGRPAPTNNPTDNRRPIMASNRKVWRVVAEAIVVTNENETVADLHNGIELLYMGEPHQIEDLECVRLMPAQARPDQTFGISAERASADHPAPVGAALARIRADHLRSLDAVGREVDDQEQDDPLHPHNTMQDVVDALSGAFRVAGVELNYDKIEGGEE